MFCPAGKGRVVLNHSTHVPGLVDVLNRLVQMDGVFTVVPGQLSRYVALRARERCRVLQCVAVRCRVLLYAAGCCCVLLCVAVCCCVLLCVAVWCCVVLLGLDNCHGILRREQESVAGCCSVLQCGAVWCRVLLCVAVCCCCAWTTVTQVVQ